MIDEHNGALNNNAYKIPYQKLLDGVQDISYPCLILSRDHDHHRLLEKTLILKEEEGEEGDRQRHATTTLPITCHDIAGKIGN